MDGISGVFSIIAVVSGILINNRLSIKRKLISKQKEFICNLGETIKVVINKRAKDYNPCKTGEDVINKLTKEYDVELLIKPGKLLNKKVTIDILLTCALMLLLTLIISIILENYPFSKTIYNSALIFLFIWILVTVVLLFLKLEPINKTINVAFLKDIKDEETN